MGSENGGNEMTRVLGRMRRIDDKRGAVRVEDVYDTDISDLWSAITEPQRLTPLCGRVAVGRPPCYNYGRCDIHGESSARDRERSPGLPAPVFGGL